MISVFWQGFLHVVSRGYTADVASLWLTVASRLWHPVSSGSAQALFSFACLSAAAIIMAASSSDGWNVVEATTTTAEDDAQLFDYGDSPDAT